MKTLSAFGGDHDPNYFNRELSYSEAPRLCHRRVRTFLVSGLDEVREVESPAAREVRAQLRLGEIRHVRHRDRLHRGVLFGRR